MERWTHSSHDFPKILDGRVSVLEAVDGFYGAVVILFVGEIHPFIYVLAESEQGFRYIGTVVVIKCCCAAKNKISVILPNHEVGGNTHMASLACPSTCQVPPSYLGFLGVRWILANLTIICI